MKSLEEYICVQLSRIYNKLDLQVYTVLSERVADHSLFPLQPTLSVTRASRFILITKLMPVSNARRKEIGPVFVFGLLASEYCITEPAGPTTHRIYIEKIDTTGFAGRTPAPASHWRGTPPGTSSNAARSLSLPQACVLGYMTYLTHICAKDTLWFHVFARAQAVYLFPDSQKNDNKQKSILSNGQLIRWWGKRFTQTGLDAQGRDARAYWFVPNEAESSLSAMSPTSTHGVNTAAINALWHWGMPYDEDANAAELVPRFPDDPKLKVLTRHTGTESLSVADFTNLLGTTGECAGSNLSALFALSISKCDDTTIVSRPIETRIACRKFRTIHKELMTRSYNGVASAMEATARLCEYLKSISVEPVFCKVSKASFQHTDILPKPKKISFVKKRNKTPAKQEGETDEPEYLTNISAEPMYSEVSEGSSQHQDIVPPPKQIIVYNLQSLVRKKNKTPAKQEAETDVPEYPKNISVEPISEGSKGSKGSFQHQDILPPPKQKIVHNLQSFVKKKNKTPARQEAETDVPVGGVERGQVVKQETTAAERVPVAKRKAVDDALDGGTSREKVVKQETS
ncbi:histone acetylation protein-domain-containing protein [Phlyctochytrium arcticum]|nr:histone acetylation protein-domain-containing protein [Phlyctochytrium arcticum]